MPQQRRNKKRSNEADMQLALLAIEKGQIQSIPEAAATFNVLERTLRNRLKGMASRRDCPINSKKYTELEERVIIDHTLEVSARGFSINLDMLRDMANQLRVDRGVGPVGKNWPQRFVQRVPELQIRVNRKYDYQRALNENPEIIQSWFRLVHNTKAKYGILDDDTYNFDEVGFQMGVISTRLVITGTERRAAPKSLQPGNTEWVTVIVAASAIGWALPPFFILKGKQQYNTWYEAIADRPDWILSMSEKGWTSLVHGFEWLQHFHRHTEARTKGAYRLLIMDGHDSHNTIEFRNFCKNHKIITLCMPPHSSHLLQPLDVGCFAPLKRAYSREIEDFIRCRINHITKEEFLPAFRAAFDKAITTDNICGAFRGAGLIPFDPDAVVSKLDIRLRTPSPLPAVTPQWQSQTPRNAIEVGAQTEYVRQRVQRHQNSSPTSIIESLASLEKGVSMIAHGASIMEVEIARLRKANTLLSKRKQHKKKVLKGAMPRSIADGLQLSAQLAGQDIDRQNGASDDGPVRRQRRCGRCREPGHRVETCPQPQLTAPENVDPSLLSIE
jgi:hypothetical protein